MDENQIKHRLNAADIITLLRIFGTILLLILGYVRHVCCF